MNSLQAKFWTRKIEAAPAIVHDQWPVSMARPNIGNAIKICVGSRSRLAELIIHRHNWLQLANVCPQQARFAASLSAMAPGVEFWGAKDQLSYCQRLELAFIFETVLVLLSGF